MRKRVFIGGIFLALLAAACTGSPPTQIVIVVTATLENGAASAPTANNSATEVQATASPTATEAAPPQNTPTPNAATTPTFAQIQIAEQVFERGRMFWLQPSGEIWVLFADDAGGGSWQIYEDTFVEGELELDADIEPPENLMQPVRGFGKLWRENEEVREGLGWALTPEFGYVSSYEYHPGGEVDAAGNFITGPGFHIWFSLFGERFRFNEVDSSWEVGDEA